MIDYGAPVDIGGDKKGGTIRIKRGGTGKIGNSGNAPKRFRIPGRQNRDYKKRAKGSGNEFRQVPWPDRGKVI